MDDQTHQMYARQICYIVKYIFWIYLILKCWREKYLNVLDLLKISKFYIEYFSEYYEEAKNLEILKN